MCFVKQIPTHCLNASTCEQSYIVSASLTIIESYTYTVVGVLCRITADRGYSQASQSAISVNKNSMTKLAFVTCMCK